MDPHTFVELYKFLQTYPPESILPSNNYPNYEDPNEFAKLKYTGDHNYIQTDKEKYMYIEYVIMYIEYERLLKCMNKVNKG
jgi:hypothetical protein